MRESAPRVKITPRPSFVLLRSRPLLAFASSGVVGVMRGVGVGWSLVVVVRGEGKEKERRRRLASTMLVKRRFLSFCFEKSRNGSRAYRACVSRGPFFGPSGGPMMG